MAMYREQFEEFPLRSLKKLIIINLEFLDDVAPFQETREIILDIKNRAAVENKKDKLQEILLNLMQIVRYWDTHQAPNGFFKAAEKSIVKGMLNNIIAKDINLDK